jgi:hypothetical protein
MVTPIKKFEGVELLDWQKVRTRKSCERASQEPAWPVRVADAVAVAGGRG